MRRSLCGFAMCVPALLLAGPGLRAEETADLAVMQRTLRAHEATIERQQAVIERLAEQVAALEAKLGLATAPVAPPAASPASVTLEQDELAALPQGPASHVLERPWYENIRIDGFGGAGFVWTGGQAAKPHGGFLNYEATLNVDAQVWDDVRYFHELQTVRLGDENTKFVRTGEVYVHFKDLAHTLFGREGIGVGAKLGREDIPVGEDYLTQDVTENPLVTLSAAYPYGWDEGLVLYGRLGGLGWILGLMDGTDARAVEDNADKFVSVKLYGQPTKRLDLSASAFRNGESSQSAWELGGSHLVPVGSGGLTSAAGASTSRSVDAYSYELDGRYALGPDRYLKAQFGSVFVDDDDSRFDRTIYYVQLEPKWNLGPALRNNAYLVARVSAVGTFDADEGYAFDGKPFANGSAAFGFDTRSLMRYAVGAGYWVNPRTLIKVEYALDDFRVISQSSLDDEHEQRDLLAMMVATKF